MKRDTEDLTPIQFWSVQIKFIVDPPKTHNDNLNHSSRDPTRESMRKLRLIDIIDGYMNTT